MVEKLYSEPFAYKQKYDILNLDKGYISRISWHFKVLF